MSSIRELRGDEIAARDGTVGSVEDVYFDQHWAVRYFVADTRGWLPGRQALIRPASLDPGLSSGRKIRLALTREQVASEPVGEDVGEARLRSGADVIGYAIEARDGAVGEVRDLEVDEQNWAIRDVLVDTRRWLPGGQVHVRPGDVERIDWRSRTVHLRLTREQVRGSSAAKLRSP